MPYAVELALDSTSAAAVRRAWRELADYVIDNSGTREATTEQVRRVFATLMSELRSRSPA